MSVAGPSLFFVWLHLIAAISWIGGMIFLSLVLAPLVRNNRTVPEFMTCFRSAARRFRIVVWGAMVVLLATGPLLLRQRGLPLFDPTGWPQVLRIKLAAVSALVLLTVGHDLFQRSQARTPSAIPDDASPSWHQTIVHTATLVPRLALLLALAVLFAAVVLSRS